MGGRGKYFFAAALWALWEWAGFSQGNACELPRIRFCMDPGNFPLSNLQGEGFQNKIAQVLAKTLHAQAEYFWYTYYSRGLLRNTLGARNCEVLFDVPPDMEGALTTRPYYKSTYVLVYRKDRGFRVQGLDDPLLHKLSIGVFQTSPIREALRRRGIFTNTVVHYVFYDSLRHPEDHPAEQVERLIEGKLDVAATWGPMAGYYAAQRKAPLEILAVNQDEKELPLDYAMSLAVPKNETRLKACLEWALEQSAAQIRQILQDYGIPLVSCAQCLVAREGLPPQPLAGVSGNAPGKEKPPSPPSRIASSRKLSLWEALEADDVAGLQKILPKVSPKELLDQNPAGDTPLLAALRLGHFGVAELLIQAGAPFQVRDREGWTPLHFVVWKGPPSLVRLLLERGADPNLPTTDGWDPLSLAVLYRDSSLVRLLLEHGAKPIHQNRAGNTALLFAVAQAPPEVVALLLDHGASPNLPNLAGITPLMVAVAKDRLDVGKLLMERGANPAWRNQDGDTALDLARKLGRTQWIPLLSKQREPR
jgi:quinoprotein dehydrogenase-associated probable ABC transporter substrate-binding protein